MGKLMGLVLLTLSVALVGCRTRGDAPADSRVRIADNIEGFVYVSDIRCIKGAGGHTTVQANVVNRTSKEQWIDWKVVWQDAAGMDIDSIVSTWNSAALAPRDVRGLANTAPREDATTMRIYVRRTVR